MFDHIRTLGKYLRCDFTIGIKEILEDDVNCLLDGVCITISQVGNVICVDSCDYFLP